MSNDINARKLGRRRLTTRRLMRHPARAQAESSLPIGVDVTGMADGGSRSPAPEKPSNWLTAQYDDSGVSSDRPTVESGLTPIERLPPMAAVPSALEPGVESAPANLPRELAPAQNTHEPDDTDDEDTQVVELETQPADSAALAPTTRSERAPARPDLANLPLAAAHDLANQDDARIIELVPPQLESREFAAALQTSAALPEFSPIVESSPLARALLAAEHTASVRETTAVLDGATRDGSHEREPEAKTRPKIRLPDGGTRRPSPRPASPSSPPASTDATRSSDRPSASAGPGHAATSARGMSPLPPPPALPGALASSLAAAATGLPVTPTGEGIIRSSLPPRYLGDRDSDLPTRPRIPLTHDMALAAGRMSVESAALIGEEDLTATRPRFALPNREHADNDSSATVVVSRARVISDRPPALDDGEPTRPVARASRRSRPDSEEFETLELDEGEEEPGRLELSGSANARGSEPGVRVSRTPPPPPAQHGSGGGKRGSATASLQRGAPPPPPPSTAAKKPASQAGAASGSAAKSGNKKRAWWEVLFSDDYVRTLAKLSPALVTKQINFMESSLGIKRGDAVLDVGCGLGQHALEFARRGYLVVALDLALSMITRAAEDAQQHGLRINFLHKDIRDIGFEGTFDAVICVGTTFGFFDDEQNRSVLQRLAHALKPGGRLLLDVVNRDHVIASQPNLVWFEGESCVVMEESDFNFYSSRLNVKRTMMREDGRQTESEYSIRLYSVHELGQMLKQAGFSIKEVSGQEATRGLFFGAQSGRIIMLAERRAGGRSRDDSVPPGTEP
jgi:2-polyprenyl-3-methyl-5-hydroxy-6-metoxy-1,4-benzoquinol methylase